MTCITVVRLGPITNSKQPQNELTAAKKGRIAYLPVDVTANTNFLPKNLLNIDSLVLLDGEVHSKLFSLMSNMRGTKQYHNKLAMDIRWMIRRLGPPTLFVTCSMAEWYSEPLLSYIRNVNRTVAGIEDMTPGKLCELDPISVIIHLKQKWEAIFKRDLKLQRFRNSKTKIEKNFPLTVAVGNSN